MGPRSQRVVLGFTCGWAVAACTLVNNPDDHTEQNAGGMTGSPDAGTGNGADANVGSAPIPAAEFCDRLADVFCQAQRDCCPSGTTTDAACRAATLPECASTFGAWAMDARTGYSPTTARTVIDRGLSLVSTCDLDAIRWSNFEVLEVYEGVNPANAECLPLDENDVPAILSCRDSLVCRSGDGTARCGEPIAVGETCAISAECVTGNYCALFDDGTQTFTACTALGGGGELCFEDAECETFSCDNGSCVGVTADLFCGDDT